MLHKRRKATEPAIGNVKADGSMPRGLKGGDGDAIRSVLCGVHNLQRISCRTCRCFS